VKHEALDSVLDELAPLLGETTAVVSLLNGLDSEDIIAARVGAKHVVAAVVNMSMRRVGPTTVRVTAPPRISFASYAGTSDPRIDGLVDAFVGAGISAEVKADYRDMLWTKLVWNAPFNPLCALARVPAGKVVEIAEDTVRAAMHEVVDVARACGVPMVDGIVDLMIEITKTSVPHTAPSMAQDVEAKRPTEVETLDGSIERLGKEHGVPAPVLSTLAALIRARTAGFE
jgi:2-dehydropantoate 2-reductase